MHNIYWFVLSIQEDDSTHLYYTSKNKWPNSDEN